MELETTKKIKVFYFAPENSGVAFYRFYQPLEDLKERGFIELRSWGFDFTEKIFDFPSIKELKEIADWGDIFIFGRRDVKEYFFAIQAIKEFSQKPVLLDIDDNIFDISPYLAARVGYNPNGEAIKIHEAITKYVDGIVVSTPFLDELYRKYNKNIKIVPNGVKNVFIPKSHEGINIGYLVSGSHLENSKIIEGAILRILRKYSNVKFYYTKAFSGFMDFIPQEIEKQVNFLPWLPLKNYLNYVNNLGLDIGLAPLMDNYFNRAKSNIRVLEYWQNRMAVIATPLDEYNKTITHGFDGYLSQDDEWEHWLEDLIQHPDRRRYLMQNSLQTLKNYDISIFADKYYNIIREIINGAHTR